MKDDDIYTENNKATTDALEALRCRYAELLGAVCAVQMGGGDKERKRLHDVFEAHMSEAMKP